LGLIQGAPSALFWGVERSGTDLLQLDIWSIKIAEGNSCKVFINDWILNLVYYHLKYWSLLQSSWFNSFVRPQILFGADTGRAFSAIVNDKRPVIDLLQLYMRSIKIAEGNSCKVFPNDWILNPIDHHLKYRSLLQSWWIHNHLWPQISFGADTGRAFSAILGEERPVIDLLQLDIWSIKIAEGNSCKVFPIDWFLNPIDQHLKYWSLLQSSWSY